MYLGRHVKCTIFLSDFNLTWVPSKEFCKSPQYEISQKSVQFSAALMLADRHNEYNKPFSRLARTHLKITVFAHIQCFVRFTE
jgi:hypothetical protein